MIFVLSKVLFLSSLSYSVLDNLHGPVREEGKIIYVAYHIRLFFHV
jgi:hypothetical protein